MHIVIIDGFHLAYRMAFALKNLSTVTSGGETIPTGMPYGFFRNGIFYLRDKFPGAQIIVAWDRKPTRKLAVNPEYKAGRVRSKEITEAFTVMDWLKIAVAASGAINVELAGEEADDVAATIAEAYYAAHLEAQIVLYTADDDYLQLVNDRIKVLKPVMDSKKDAVFCDRAYVETEWGVAPEKMPLLRAIIGDSSDALPGIKRFPRKLAQCLANSFSSPKDMYENLMSASLPSMSSLEKWLEALVEARSLVEQNYEMMQLNKSLTLSVPEPQKDDELLKSMFIELGFKSLLSRV